ncbi:Protein of unknown function DUF4612 [Trinorchestia longiramus]|nr:Protein of unknown function DUF4612 [Trinorchestia longiramus]
MVETSRSSRFLVVSPVEGTAKKLPKSKQCPKKISSVLWALRSCLCGCCCCSSCSTAAAASPSDDSNSDAQKDELQRETGGRGDNASKGTKKKKTLSSSLEPLLKILPPSMSSPSSPTFLYDDPFSFFGATERTFDNAEGTSSFNRGLLGLMEGLATCRRPPSAALGPDKNFPVSPQAAKVSDSQIDFFKMLDERIENGPDDESVNEARCKLFSRSTSDGEHRHGPPTTGGDHPSALYRRWSASKITNPRTPSSPDEHGSNTMRREFLPDSRSPESPLQIEGCPLDRLMPDASGVLESPSDDGSLSDQPKENFKEHYVFLGNIYTVTKPATRKSSLPTADRSPSPTLVAVNPRMTEEDLHLQTLLDNSAPCYQNEKMLGGELSPDTETNQFWMDFDSPGLNDKQTNKVVKARGGRGVSCDIVRPSLSGLRPVRE